MCLRSSWSTCLGTHAKAHFGKHLICNFLCGCVGTSEWWNATFILLQCWLEERGAYHSSLHFSWAWGLAVFFGDCVSLISTKYHMNIYFPIFFDSNASWSLPPPLGLYIYNLISSLLQADIAINLHKSSKCKVTSSFKNCVNMATTASSARAATFMAFLALALFGLCLTVIMSLAEEYESLFSHTEEDTGNCPLSKPVPNPHCGCLGDDPICHGTHFCGGVSLQYAACHKCCWVQEHYGLLDKRSFKIYHGFQT